MKAEERKEIEQNSLAKWLGNLRAGTGGKSSLYFYGGLVVLLLAVIIGWNWWSNSRARGQAELWVALDNADREKLKELDEKYRGELIGQSARVRRARLALGPDGLDRLGTTDSDERKKAVASIEEARDLYTSVAPELKDNPVLQQEAWVGAAKAEEALLGVPKEDKQDQMRGSVDKVIEYYQKARQIAGDTDAGKELDKTIKELTDNKQKLELFYADVNRQLSTPRLPPLPPFPPLKKE